MPSAKEEIILQLNAFKQLLANLKEEVKHADNIGVDGRMTVEEAIITRRMAELIYLLYNVERSN